MTTSLERPLRRELRIDDKAYTLLLDGDGFRLTEKGRRKGLSLRWSALINGDAAVAAALNAAIAPRRTAARHLTAG
ncbi:MAG: hypothetical protein ABI411_10275 [Tahibacter sp.]